MRDNTKGHNTKGHIPQGDIYIEGRTRKGTIMQRNIQTEATT